MEKPQKVKGTLYFLGDNDEVPKEIEIDIEHFCIGNAQDNHFCLDMEDGKVSRYHAEIYYDKNKKSFLLKDLDSTNGTYLQGKKIEPHKTYIIANKDYVQFSRFPFQFFYGRNENTGRANNVKVYKPGEAVADLQAEANGENIVKGSGGIKYVIDSPLKKGGMGTLFKARRLNDKQPVVLKFLPQSELENTKSVLRFITEAKTIISLKHKNIVRGLDLNHDMENCFLVMEYIEGQSVEEMLESQNSVAVDVATNIVRDIAEALIYLEHKNVFHRDIKPGNIIWTNTNKAILVDFGIAKTDNISLTTKGFVMGTDLYLSPEQVLGKKIDVRSDIYSLGATYYHMVTGKIPFFSQGCTSAEIVKQRLYNTPVPADVVNKQVPVVVAQTIETMMEPNANDRVNSPESLLKRLDEIISRLK